MLHPVWYRVRKRNFFPLTLKIEIYISASFAQKIVTRNKIIPLWSKAQFLFRPSNRARSNFRHRTMEMRNGSAEEERETANEAWRELSICQIAEGEDIFRVRGRLGRKGGQLGRFETFEGACKELIPRKQGFTTSKRSCKLNYELF